MHDRRRWHAGTMTQSEAKSVLAMAPARPLGPIRRDGRAAGGSQSGRQRLKGCVCVPCKGGRGSHEYYIRLRFRSPDGL